MTDQEKAAEDAVLHGMGVVQNGKHIQLEEYYAESGIAIETAMAIRFDAFGDGRKYERQQTEREIVAWLREMAANGTPFGLDGMASLGLPLDIAADAIEAGEYRK